jgi:hypothetical protein
MLGAYTSVEVDMLEIRGLNAWKNKTEAAKRKIKSKATDYVRREVVKVFRTVLRESPQYSGDFVSNWHVITSYFGSSSYMRLPYKDFLSNKLDESGPRFESYIPLVRQVGHPEAIGLAMRRSQETIDNIKWNTKITIVNYAPIASDIATGNLNPAYRPVHAHLEGQSFVSYIKQKHGLGWIG